MGRIESDRSPDGENAEIARLRAELEALKADKARKEKQPGWYVKEVKRTNKDGTAKDRPGRFNAERILPDGSIVSYFVGFNGKLTVGSHYGTTGLTLWNGGDDETALDEYILDDGPDGMAADRNRVRATGLWEAAPAK